MCPANGWLSHGSALASRVIVPAISKHSDAINGNQHALASRVIVPAISMHSDAINGNQEQSSTISGHQGHSDANRGIKGGNQGRQSSAIKCTPSPYRSPHSRRPTAHHAQPEMRSQSSLPLALSAREGRSATDVSLERES
jgi:hypothetical protein